MTGDGLRLAILGALLAAREALQALETGIRLSVTRLAEARSQALGTKLASIEGCASSPGRPRRLGWPAAARSLRPG